MKSHAFALLVPSILAWTAAAELTFSATAIHAGKQVDTSGLEFLPIPPRSHHHRNSSSPLSRSRPRPGKRAAVSYSDNWCGVSQHTTAANPITGVSGVFSTPSLTIRPSEPIPQFAAAWIGIDGASCQNSLLQAGTSTVVCLLFALVCCDRSVLLTPPSLGQFQWRTECLCVVGMGAECIVLNIWVPCETR